MGGPNGAVTRGVAVDFSSLEQAFEGAGREVERFDEARKAADEEVAGRVVGEFVSQYSAGATERWAAYDGRELGQDAAEIGLFDAQAATIRDRPDLSDGEREAVRQQLQTQRAAIAARAMATAAETRARRFAADRDAFDASEANRTYDEFYPGWNERHDAITDAYDGTTDLPTELATAFEEYRAERMQGVPQRIADRLNPRLDTLKTQLVMNAVHGQEQAQTAIVARNATAGATALVNRVAANPGLLGQVDADVEAIAATLPALARPEFVERARNEAYSRGLEARVHAGDFEGVRAEIEQGRYDWMDPARVARLNEEIKAQDAIITVTDIQEAADLDAEQDQAIAAVLAGSDYDQSLIGRVTETLGPAAGVSLSQELESARRVRPLMLNYRTMTDAQVNEVLAGMAGEAGNAVGARTLAKAQELVQQHRALRNSDPAAYAATPVGPGDRIAAGVQERLTAFNSNPTPETARAYARATLTAQAASQIDERQRRILDAATADQWVAGLDADGVPGAALPDLARRLALFGPENRGQLVRELRLAGLTDRDYGALTHYGGSASKMDLYVQGRAALAQRQGQGGRAVAPSALVEDEGQRRETARLLTSQLADYDRTLASGSGRGATREAAEVVAYSMVARGESPRDAVRAATAPMVDNWEFRDTYAIPTNRGLDVRLITANTGWVVADLLAQNGAGLKVPANPRYSPEQNRRNYRDYVDNQSRWLNGADGNSVYLAVPAADGVGWVTVTDAQNRPVVRTWDQLNRRRVRRGAQWVFE